MANKELWNSGSINRESVHEVSSAPKGVDSAQWEANPYANIDYNQSPWQKLLANLGFRTGYDAYRESMALQAKEYEASLLDKAHNEQYDSAESQVMRERAAGINPDLSGNVDAGGSSPLSDDGNPPVAPEGDDFQQAAGLAGAVMNCVQMASGIASTGLDFVTRITDMRGKKIDNDSKLLNTAFEAMLGVTTAEDMDNFMDSDLSVQAVNYLPALTEVFGSKRAKKYVSAVNRVAHGLSGHDLEMKLRNSFAQNWVGYHDTTSGDGFSMFKDTMQVIRKEFSTNLWENLRNSAKLESRQIENQQSYEDVRAVEGIPGAIAHNEGVLSAYDVTQSGQQIRKNDMQLAMRTSFDNLVKEMNDLADKGNWFAGITAIFLQFVGARFLGM